MYDDLMFVSTYKRIKFGWEKCSCIVKGKEILGESAIYFATFQKNNAES